MMSNEELQADVIMLAAGFGTRLRPETLRTPKPLLKVAGKPLIEFNLDLVRRCGGRRVIINLHHLGEQIRSALGSGTERGLEIIYSEEAQILDTGGAIKQMEGALRSENFIVLNGDTIFGPDFDLRALLAAHMASGAAITAVVREDAAMAYTPIGLDEHLEIRSIGEAEGLTRLMFAGAQAVAKSVLDRMPPAGEAFSMTHHVWKKLLAERMTITGFRYDGYWNDVGTPLSLRAASKEVPGIFHLSQS